MKCLSLTIALFFLLFAVILANFFRCFIVYVIKMKYILLQLKAPIPMSVISETYNRAHNILELVDILLNVSFTASEMKRDFYY